MSTRITISISATGELELWLNEAGRDLLLRKLTALSERSDHFHLGAYEGAETELSDRAYRSTDKIIHAAKVMLRPDEWDRKYFPHVFGDDPPEEGTAS